MTKPVPMPMPPSLFSARLRYLRQRAHLTQQDMADRLQIDRSTYTKYETKSISPDQIGLLRIAEIFGVTVDYLLGRSEDSTPTLAVESNNEQICLDEQEKLLLQTFRRLSPEKRQTLLNKIREYTLTQNGR